MNFNKVSKVFIAAVTVIVIIYDIVAFSLQPNDGTISFSMWQLSQEYPPIPLLWGFISGHFFWPAQKV
jgi:hypothetical protein